MRDAGPVGVALRNASLHTRNMVTKYLSIAAVLLLSLSANARADKREDLAKEVKDAIGLFNAKDSSMKKLFSESVAYAVFPSVAKGGLGLGAANGNGQLFEKGEVVGESDLTQVRIGFQVGGQIYSEVVFFENDAILKDFKEGHLKFSAQVSAVAAADGVSQNAKFDNGVAVFTLAKGGLMYEASVGGQKFGYKAYDHKPAATGAATAATPPAGAPTDDSVEKLQKLKKMKEQGLISDQEYEKKKAEILSHF